MRENFWSLGWPKGITGPLLGALFTYWSPKRTINLRKCSTKWHSVVVDWEQRWIDTEFFQFADSAKPNERGINQDFLFETVLNCPKTAMKLYLLLVLWNYWDTTPAMIGQWNRQTYGLLYRKTHGSRYMATLSLRTCAQNIRPPRLPQSEINV